MKNSFFDLDLSFGFDGLSVCFIILLVLIILICLFLEYRNLNFQFKLNFLICILSIQTSLFIAFSTLDLFSFFLAFESILIPMFFIIGLFGSNKRKVKAAYYFFMYSFSFSLPFLYVIIYIYSLVGSTYYGSLLDYNFSVNQQIII